ncbi:hypothetical protein PPISBEST_229 [Bacillus phage PPIsBest]|uniref:Uncharacterized protein n=1 Tax=Bacillus phage PPIsBest TaxID=2024234 RepID=A0A222Z202_9CAUD|nr:hypothetical protein BIZ89_gp232 [Bacillus phage Kida]ANU79853.1 hypothetical protein KIDA_234 [Bacillus phage Kida]ASR78193.1 hypothetical protein PPISBEST_229 [Bacillus phage PPIsBest]ULF49433.1 membrane protein [Bacillus phage MrBubbles]
MLPDKVKEAIVGILAIIGGLTVANIIIQLIPSVATLLFYVLLGGIGAYVALKVKKYNESK